MSNILSIFTDIQYLKQISFMLDSWEEKKTSPHHSVCRCHICGDSKKNKKKKRGNFYEKDGKILYHCHNCGASSYLGKIIKDLSAFVYRQYIAESFGDSVSKPTKKEYAIPKVKVQETLTKQVSDSTLDGTVEAFSLPDDHPVRKYVESRMIPKEHRHLFRYAKKFYAWARTNTDKFNQMSAHDHPRLVMPWYNEDGFLFAYQARAFGDEIPKYYTIVLNDNYPKVYGLDRINKTKRVYVVEGPIDSLFLPNCVAVASSALTTYQNEILPTTYVFDNEPRNSEIVKLIGKAIKSGHHVFVPPDTYKHKDINEAIQAGLTSDFVKMIIDENTFHGATAMLKYNLWKRS